MMNVNAIRGNTFTLVPLLDGPVPIVKFSGNGDAEALNPLDRFLKLLHKNLLDEKCTSVCIDLSDLYFMNSACLKAFVSWVHKVDTMENPYQIRLLRNPRQPWQERSLETLVRLAPRVVHLEEVSAAPEGSAR